MKFINEIAAQAKCIEKCGNVAEIKDINDQYRYIDDSRDGKNDRSLVSCGQDGSFNELRWIYNEKLISKVNSSEITRDKAISALCVCCCELTSPRKREDYYACLNKKLKLIDPIM